MVSDVLSEALNDIFSYLDEGPATYDGEIRARILTLCDHMEEVRRELDTPPRTERESVQ